MKAAPTCPSGKRNRKTCTLPSNHRRVKAVKNSTGENLRSLSTILGPPGKPVVWNHRTETLTPNVQRYGFGKNSMQK